MKVDIGDFFLGNDNYQFVGLAAVVDYLEEIEEMSQSIYCCEMSVPPCERRRR